MSNKIQVDTETAEYMVKIAKAIQSVGDAKVMDRMMMAVSRVEFVLDGDVFELCLEPDGDFPNRFVIERHTPSEEGR